MRFLLSLVVLLALLVAVGLPLALLGMPVAPLSVVLLAAALFPLVRKVRLPSMMEEETVEERWPRPVALLARVALLLAVALFLAKVALAPLWSWDHFAIWGLKSRQMVVEGRLDLGFLALPGFELSSTYYPIGLPVLWCLLALGGLPGTALFKVVHALLGLALVAVTRRGVLRLGLSPTVADALAALLAASPLLWDTITVGLADLPLALWVTAGLVLVLESSGDHPGSVWPAGVCLGFLPWIKQEGLPLALLALAAAAVMVSSGKGRKPRLAALLLPAGLLIAGALAIGRTLPKAGTAFLDGDWRGRGLERLSRPGEILTMLGSDLAAPDWLGFWFLFAACLAFALWRALRREYRRNRTALLLAGVVVLQLGLYGAIYFCTYLPVADHILSSFTRITAALVPLGILAIAASGREMSNGWRLRAGM
ncbi:MAG TPA: glycosyltransferase 87 family protein [Thermoanaerobaculia bacterium]|nr:glycosyltransferase 87 family protein [Thermoanaerobaculia bacterium]